MTDYRSRVIGLEQVSTKELRDNPANFRRHPQAQGDALRGVLEQVGIAGALLAYRSERAGGALALIDGHLRKDQAPQTWPVLVLDVTDAEADLLLATHDPIAAMAQSDAAALDALLRGVSTDSAAVQSMLAELAADAGLYADKPALRDAEPQIDRAEELRQKWGVEPGDLWQLGEHRLICGDCTDPATVDRAMGGERASLAPVDPPYNVGFDYDGNTVDDNKAVDAYEQFSRAWFGVCQLVSVRQIVTPGCNNLESWMRWFDSYHVSPWTKSNSMANGKVTRFWCWEPVIFYGDKWPRRQAHDLFDFPISKQKNVANHPCPKPLAMWLDLIENYSEPGDLIYEAFNGSGTTIIACEQLGRRCRAVEISPGYVAVALERWATVTALPPERIGNHAPA